MFLNKTGRLQILFIEFAIFNTFTLNSFTISQLFVFNETNISDFSASFLRAFRIAKTDRINFPVLATRKRQLVIQQTN